MPGVNFSLAGSGRLRLLSLWRCNAPRVGRKPVTMPFRALRSTSTPNSPKRDVKLQEQSSSSIVNMINKSLDKHPYASLSCLAAADIVSIYSIHSVLSLLDVTFPVGFAVAFVVARPLKRFRYRLESL